MIYLDCHASTPCDPRVVEAMLPWLTEKFANPHSESHAAGREAADAIDHAMQTIASAINAPPSSLLITSGATESINLAMRGVMTHPRNKRNGMIVATTEHPAVLDVARDLSSCGVEVAYVGVDANGLVDLDALKANVTEHTALVNVMFANNEIGTIAPITEIARITHDVGAVLHCDATQAVGRIDVDVEAMQIDLLSASAHKFYGPKGIGFLVAGGTNRRVRLRPQMIGGGQQQGQRGGTMNPAGIVAMATAIGLTGDVEERLRIARLRDRFWRILTQEIENLTLNGPPLNDPALRLPGNLNFHLAEVEGETWMAATPHVAFSSGSACSSMDQSASHVLRAIGLSESEARRSVRFGIGRFTTEEQIDIASEQLVSAYRRF